MACSRGLRTASPLRQTNRSHLFCSILKRHPSRQSKAKRRCRHLRWHELEEWSSRAQRTFATGGKTQMVGWSQKEDGWSEKRTVRVLETRTDLTQVRHRSQGLVFGIDIPGAAHLLHVYVI